MSNKIKAPLINLEEWRINNIPESVWNNENLQAYLKARQILIRLALILMAILSYIVGAKIWI